MDSDEKAREVFVGGAHCAVTGVTRLLVRLLRRLLRVRTPAPLDCEDSVGKRRLDFVVDVVVCWEEATVGGDLGCVVAVIAVQSRCIG